MKRPSLFTLSIIVLVGLALVFILFFDMHLATFLQSLYPKLVKIAKPINAAMDERIVLISCVLLFAIFRFFSSSFFWHMLFFHMLITQCIGQGVLRIIKVVIGRARPYMALEAGHTYLNVFNFCSDFHSFPSGHALGLFIVASSLSYRFPKGSILFFPLAFCLSLTRAVLLKHFVSDILVSLVLALLLAKLVYYFSYSIVDKKTLNLSLSEK